MKVMLFNPYTGKPRDPRDIASDPSGALMVDPDEPLFAARPGARVAPWSDYKGATIREGDVLVHPSGEMGIVEYLPNEDPWRVRYPDGVSRLQLQVGERGRAVVRK